MIRSTLPAMMLTLVLPAAGSAQGVFKPAQPTGPVDARRIPDRIGLPPAPVENPAQFSILVSGGGSVRGSFPSCGSTAAGAGVGTGIAGPKGCMVILSKTKVATFEAVARPGWHLAKWIGPCGGSTQTTCTTSLAHDNTIRAYFDPDGAVLMRLQVYGKGRIRLGAFTCAGSQPENAECAMYAPTGKPLAIVAEPDAGQAFVLWQMNCGGQTSATCMLTPHGGGQVVARFAPKP